MLIPLWAWRNDDFPLLKMLQIKAAEKQGTQLCSMMEALITFYRGNSELHWMFKGKFIT